MNRKKLIWSGILLFLIGYIIPAFAFNLEKAGCNEITVRIFEIEDQKDFLNSLPNEVGVERLNFFLAAYGFEEISYEQQIKSMKIEDRRKFLTSKLEQILLFLKNKQNERQCQ